MKNYEVSLLDYDELSKEEQEKFYYSEDDTYLKVNGKLYSDAIEPYILRFYRDLSWIHAEIDNAYAAGYADGLDNA